MCKRYVALLIWAISMVIPSVVHAESEEDMAPKLAYFTLEPEITTNFVTPGSRIGYIKIKVDIIVADSADVPLVEKHQPLIRNVIIDLLGQQTEENIKTLPGREELRITMIKLINDALLGETGKTLVSNLLFTNYLYH